MVIELSPIQHVPPPIALPRDCYFLQTSILAGSEYYQFQDLDRNALDVGTTLTLIAEPANPHDQYAVRVQLVSIHLGYLPRTSNHIVSLLLQQGAPLQARVAWLNHESDPPLTLHVLLKKDPQT